MNKESEKIIVANWKMQLNIDEAKDEAKKIKKLAAGSRLDKKIKIVVCPNFLSLTEVAKVFKGSRVALGAQDSFYEDRGAFTGEVSMKDLKDLGCQYVILGHSERRQMGETDEVINKKVKTALRDGLVPIICVGETFDERREGQKDFVVMNQVYRDLEGVDFKPGQNFIIAYEPVWVIGTGQAIDHTEASHMSSVIKQSLIDVLNGKNLSAFSIIYGGSVNPQNIKEFTNLPDISGCLVGTASLQAKTFFKIIKSLK
jgi:triosephosphate isomerase